jgi:hypothetical protein
MIHPVTISKTPCRCRLLRLAYRPCHARRKLSDRACPDSQGLREHSMSKRTVKSIIGSAQTEEQPARSSSRCAPNGVGSARFENTNAPPKGRALVKNTVGDPRNFTFRRGGPARNLRWTYRPAWALEKPPAPITFTVVVVFPLGVVVEVRSPATLALLPEAL